MHLYHASGDHEVPFENSQRAYDYFKANGADVELIDLGDKTDHEMGAPKAFDKSLMWFETFLL